MNPLMNSFVKGLGEIALSVSDLTRSIAFYRDTIGLTLIRETETFAFLKVAEGIGGHIQVVALFKASQPPSPERTRLHHLAFGIERENFEAVKASLAEKKIQFWTEHHAWIEWSSIYIEDPEMNVVEFVCKDIGNQLRA